jgi:putative phosphoribosyl transferase
MFKNRTEAAEALVRKLQHFKNTNAIVLAIPRGGIPLGAIVAKALSLPLEPLLAKKVGHPKNPEYAIASVSLQGTVINSSVRDVSLEYIQRECARVQKSLVDKFQLFMGGRNASEVQGKIVILIDDGVATGNTLLAAIDAVKKSNPLKIVLAVPVAAPSAAELLKREVDEFHALLIPDDFRSVGQFYQNFDQVTDAEVIALLKSLIK